MCLQVAMKFKQASKELLETHYEDLKAKPFFPGLVEYMASGPVVPMVRFKLADPARKALLSQGRDNSNELSALFCC